MHFVAFEDFPCPSSEEPPGDDDIQGFIDTSEYLFRDVWSRRHDNSDFMILGDVRIPECQAGARVFCGDPIIDNVVDGCARREARGEEVDGRPMFPYLETRYFLHPLMRSEDPNWREVARELRGFPSGLVIPVLIITREWVKVTSWYAPSQVYGQLTSPKISWN